LHTVAPAAPPKAGAFAITQNIFAFVGCTKKRSSLRNELLSNEKKLKQLANYKET